MFVVNSAFYFDLQYFLTEQKPWKLLAPMAQTILFVMETFVHILLHDLLDKTVTLTSWSRFAKVSLSPISPQPAVMQALPVLSWSVCRGISCTSLVSCALPLSWGY